MHQANYIFLPKKKGVYCGVPLPLRDINEHLLFDRVRADLQSQATHHSNSLQRHFKGNKQF